MKAMIFSDLVTSKNSFITLFGITVFVSLFIAVMTETLVTAVACIAAMVPFMYLFSISAYDEQNGWERFRLTLPISRKQVAYGRYASTLLIMLCSLALAIILGLITGVVCDTLPIANIPDGLKLSTFGIATIAGIALTVQLIILIACIFTLPLIMRFGMTKGSRIVPIVLVLALSLGIAAAGDTLDVALLGSILNNDTTVTLILSVATIILFALYVISALISARLYQQREL